MFASKQGPKVLKYFEICGKIFVVQVKTTNVLALECFVLYSIPPEMSSWQRYFSKTTQPFLKRAFECNHLKTYKQLASYISESQNLASQLTMYSYIQLQLATYNYNYRQLLSYILLPRYIRSYVPIASYFKTATITFICLNNNRVVFVSLTFTLIILQLALKI